MNYIKHLTGFFERVVKDKTLNPTHISLYVALFQFWNFNRFKNPISISRDEVMRISKISSKATYHKCLKNLHSLGYIDYQPSFNPFKGSQVFMLNFSEDLKPVSKQAKTKNEPFFEPPDEQVLNKSCTSNETSSEQALVPSINYINKTNISNDLNLGEQTQKIIVKNEAHKEDEDLKGSPLLARGVGGEEERKSSAKKKEKNEAPIIQEVEIYFQQQNYPELEAQKFFNYFSSNGWLVGGKTKMKDWQAAARNWMLNTQKFNRYGDPEDRAKHLNTTTGKDYSEPL
jgi:hypothetical protein